MRHLRSISSLLAGILGLLLLLAAPVSYAQITPQQVYENPDDHDLNLEFAKQQILGGEMLDAGSALERMLYSNPNWHSARLLYAAVLYRLDDQQAALRELFLLEGKDLNEEQLAKLESYKEAFRIPPKPYEVTVSDQVNTDFNRGSSLRSQDQLQGNVSLQLRVDDNAGNALTDASFGFGNKGDVSAVAKAQARVFVPASDQWTLRAAIGAQSRRHETFSEADYDVVDGSLGASLSQNNGVAAVDLDLRQINISGDTYLKQIGPRITFSQKLSEDTFGNFSLSVYNQDYENLPNANREEERDGRKLSIQAGISHHIGKQNKFRLAVAYEEKSATLDAFSYQGPVIAAAFDRKLDKDFYVKAQGKIRRLSFKNGDTGGFNAGDETRLSGRMAIGKNFNLGKLNSQNSGIKSTSLELGSSLTGRKSNTGSNEFSNFGLDIRLTVGI